MAALFILNALAFIAYFLESIFGFGGTVIFLGAGGFFFDFKFLIVISIYMALVASLTIIIQSWRHIAWKHIGILMLLTLPGLIVGTLMMGQLGSGTLLKVFAVFLILYGVQGIFFPQLVLHHFIGKAFVMMGGFIHGVFTTGGPFVLMGYRENFAGKTELRASMAVFFVLANIWRIAQEGIFQGGEAVKTIIEYWWTAIPIIAAVIAGYFIHLGLPETLFRRAMTIGLMSVGVVFLLK
ncbi:MAG: TSUP family transporter [Alphaproteobacteria bacterium]|nr:TSUP family transporter [Alphaproteobacteria bacterium]